MHLSRSAASLAALSCRACRGRGALQLTVRSELTPITPSMGVSSPSSHIGRALRMFHPAHCHVQTLQGRPGV